MATSFDMRSFLDEPLRPAQVATVSRSGLPLLGSLWFAFEDDLFWFTSLDGSPLLVAPTQRSAVAVLVDQFDPPGRIRQIRVRGSSRVESHDPERVYRIYRRYLGKSVDAWPLSFPERLDDPSWTTWSVSPDTGLAVDHENFVGNEMRWNVLSDCPFLKATPPIR
jgi:hypothetical protein